MGTFLDENEIAKLTGRKMKSRQIAALRQMGIPFFVNAIGRPIVTRSTLEGRKEAAPKAAWVPPILRAT